MKTREQVEHLKHGANEALEQGMFCAGSYTSILDLTDTAICLYNKNEALEKVVEAYQDCQRARKARNGDALSTALAAVVCREKELYVLEKE